MQEGHSRHVLHAVWPQLESLNLGQLIWRLLHTHILVGDTCGPGLPVGLLHGARSPSLHGGLRDSDSYVEPLSFKSKRSKPLLTWTQVPCHTTLPALYWLSRSQAHPEWRRRAHLLLRAALRNLQTRLRSTLYESGHYVLSRILGRTPCPEAPQLDA